MATYRYLLLLLYKSYREELSHCFKENKRNFGSKVPDTNTKSSRHLASALDRPRQLSKTLIENNGNDRQLPKLSIDFPFKSYRKFMENSTEKINHLI